jgi:hypothetical protein
MQESVAFRVHIIRPAVSYPGVGRFRRAETGILGMEQTGGPGGPPFFVRNDPAAYQTFRNSKGARRGERPSSYLPISACY